MIYSNYKFTKYGSFMFKLCSKWTIFIIKHKWLYYLLAFTWGCITTLIGLILSLFLFLFKNTPTQYYWVHYFTIGDYWGGFSVGTTFVRDKKSYGDSINQHEFGHTFQNTLLGPLAIVLIFIPSIIRYWVRAIAEKRGKQLKDYDAIWFESSATKCGEFAVKYLMESEYGKQ